MTNACTTFYNERRLIGSIRQYLTVDATKTHISGFLFLFFLLSRPDCCNPLLSGAPQYLLDRLKRVANAPVRLTVKASKSDHIIPILHSLHRVLVSSRIQRKIFSLCYRALSDPGPEYLSKVLRISAPSRQLLSSSDNRILRVRSVKTKTLVKDPSHVQAL